MSAPVKVDLSGSSGLWPGFTISGCTGGGAAAVNGNYELSPAPDENDDRFYLKIGGTTRVSLGTDSCSIDNGIALFNGVDSGYPWSATWSPDSGTVGGTLAFAYLMRPPVAADLGGGDDTTHSSATMVSTGTHNDILVTATPAGRIGNEILVEFVDPLVNSSPLSVSVAGFKVTVHLATNGSHQFTSTATQVIAAIAASPAASALITAANAPGNNGSGVCTAVAEQDLAGGSGGQAGPPVSVEL